jgi:hypothetical protein
MSVVASAAKPTPAASVSASKPSVVTGVGTAAAAAAAAGAGVGVAVGNMKKIGADVGIGVGVAVAAADAAAVLQASSEAVAGVATAVSSDGMYRSTRWAPPETNGMDARVPLSRPTLLAWAWMPEIKKKTDSPVLAPSIGDVAVSSAHTWKLLALP